MRLVFAMISVAMFASTSHAAGLPCAGHKDVVAALDTKYHEQLVSHGIAANKKDVVEIYISSKGTFTILATSPNGISCIIAAGENFELGKVPKEMTSL